MIYDTYSKRQRRLSDPEVDVYQYTHLDQKIKNQIYHILKNYLENGEYSVKGDYFAVLDVASKGVLEEFGLEKFPKSHLGLADGFYDFVKNISSVDELLDFLEIFLESTKVGKGLFRPIMKNHQLVKDINTRFRENNLGFEMVEGKFIRKDSEFLHGDVVIPVLHLINDSKFGNANAEFLHAHELYRSGKFESAIVECCKSFESVMKCICKANSWTHGVNDPASKLIKVLKENQLFPAYLDTQLNHLVGLLESGVPTVRNKDAGHGAGSVERNIPRSYASYVLHLAASNILFLIELDRDLVGGEE